MICDACNSNDNTIYRYDLGSRLLLADRATSALLQRMGLLAGDATERWTPDNSAIIPELVRGSFSGPIEFEIRNWWTCVRNSRGVLLRRKRERCRAPATARANGQVLI